MNDILIRKARALSWFTVLYNIAEGVVSITAGVMAGSIALTGFGLDSFVESLSAMVMIWRLKHDDTRSEAEELEREERAVRLIGWTFFIFAAYVAIASTGKLWFREKPDPSLFGIIIAVVSLIVMPILYQRKMKVARALDSRSLAADAKETLACTMLSVSLLAGLGLNYLFGLWWADPVTGFVIVYFLVREGLEAFEDEDEDDI